MPPVSVSNTEEEILEDFLTPDPPIPGQNYVVLSFIWPEKILKRKELYLMKNFLKDTLNDPLGVKRILDNLDQQKEFSYDEIEDMYESYCLGHIKDIYKQFDEENDFQTSVRSVKVRGVYDTEKEARIRSEVLKRKDPNFETWLGQHGYWLPLEPSINDDEIEQVYSNPQLNKMFSKKRENVVEKETIFDPATKAIQEAKRKESELNKLTKIYQDNLESGKDKFEKDTQRKKDHATQETERRKAEQQRVKDAEVAKTNAKDKSRDAKKGKKTHRRHNKKDVVLPDDKPLPPPVSGLPNRESLIKDLRQTSDKILNNSSAPAPAQVQAPVSALNATVVPESASVPISNQSAHEKIKELREILDERELVYQNVKNNQNDGSVGVASLTDQNVENVNNDMMLKSDRGPDIFDGQHSDPWMQRKAQQEDPKLSTMLNKIL